MYSRFHGIFSLFLISVSVLIGLLSIMSESLLMVLLYAMLILISLPTIVYSFCSKCSCRDSCSHILPGRLSKFLPPRKQGNYTPRDILGVVVPVTALLIFPQPWLWKNIPFLTIFWLLFFIALVEVNIFVCRSCSNEKCPLYPKKK